MTGVNVNIVDFFTQAEEKIKTFEGIKFTDPLLNDVTEIQDIIDKIEAKKGKRLSLLYSVFFY